MNLSKPLTSLNTSLEGQVLTVLAGAEADFTGRQVHKIIGKNSDVGVSKALQRLCKQGVVTMRSSGNSNLYKLNREHLLAKYIIAVANLRTEFFSSLRAEVADWAIQPECIAVFGSASRSNMTPDSDIDIFVARPVEIAFGVRPWREQITEFSLKVGRWTGNSVQIFELGEDEIRKELEVKDGVIYAIIDEGIIVQGPTDYLRKLHSKGGRS